MLTFEARAALIEEYITAYNNMDAAGMMHPLHEDIIFVNIAGGKPTHHIEGKQALLQQAQTVCTWFSSRAQRITSIVHEQECTIAAIDYEAIPAIDLGEGMPKGIQMFLKGKSIFRFADHKISHIEDIS